MKILILSWRDPKNPKAGGAEVVTLEHAKYWIKKGHKVIWFTSSFKNAENEEVIDDVKIIRKGNSFTVYLMAPIFYLFGGEKYDFVVDEVHGIPFFTPLYVRKPKIMFIHEVADKIWDYMYPFPVNIIGKLSEKIYFIFYKNLKIWTDAQSTIDELVVSGLRRENCFAINCPASNEVISELPKKEKNPTFIYCGRVVRMKNVEDVILAFSKIKQELKHSRLWIVGGGDIEYINELKKLVTNQFLDKDVKFFGRVSEEEKLILMRKCHMQLLSIKVHAGWCIVVIEAASQATPSVVYKTSGLQDAVKDGITGVVVENNNPEELAKATVSLLKSKTEYASMQKKGLSWASSLTWESVTKQSLSLIEEVVNEKK